jgi:hypothetical protein
MFNSAQGVHLFWELPQWNSLVHKFVYTYGFTMFYKVVWLDLILQLWWFIIVMGLQGLVEYFVGFTNNLKSAVQYVTLDNKLNV